MLQVGDTVLLSSCLLYKGDSPPAAPPKDWTAEILSTWGKAGTFYKICRFDGRVYPIMHKDIASLVRCAPAKRRRREGK